MSPLSFNRIYTNLLRLYVSLSTFPFSIAFPLKMPPTSCPINEKSVEETPIPRPDIEVNQKAVVNDENQKAVDDVAEIATKKTIVRFNQPTTVATIAKKEPPVPGVRPAPLKARKRMPSPASLIEDAVVYKQEQVPLEVKKLDGTVVGQSKLDLKIIQRKMNKKFHHHEYIAVDCFTGEVYQQFLNRMTYDDVMEKIDDEDLVPKNIVVYSKEIASVITLKTMSPKMNAFQFDEDIVIINTYGDNPSIAPRVPLVKLKGKDLAGYIQSELAKEKNDQQAAREACRQRWTELTCEITRACRKQNQEKIEFFDNESYISLLRRELTRTTTAIRNR